jgi:hypothetical protein
MTTLTEELAVAAARLIVEEGMEYGAAKRRAARVLGRHSVRTAELPSNEAVEDQVRAYIDLFHADTQPAELAALRALALRWMEHLGEFRPHVAGAVWRGTATRLSDLHLDLFCDDPKAAEIALINQGVPYEATGDEADPVLSLSSRCPELGESVTLHLHVRDTDDLRGALKRDARGRTQRGDLAALRRLVDGSPT